MVSKVENTVMKNSLIVGFIALAIWALPACESESVTPCAEIATVKDLTGLDGCGFVFELEDGTRLEPILMARCGTPFSNWEMEEDPLSTFTFVDGKRVVIGYEELTDVGSICMVGKTVRITCLKELTNTPQE
jgi:hypothetical protein